MNTIQKLIAVIASVVVACGYIIIADSNDHVGPRIVIGFVFGVGIGASMILRPDRFTKKHIAYIITPLLAALVIWMTIYETSKAMSTFIWALSYLALLVAFHLAGGDNTDRTTIIDSQ